MGQPSLAVIVAYDTGDGWGAGALEVGRAPRGSRALRSLIATAVARADELTGERGCEWATVTFRPVDGGTD